jgi:hypothetical protein
MSGQTPLIKVDPRGAFKKNPSEISEATRRLERRRKKERHCYAVGWS